MADRGILSFLKDRARRWAAFVHLLGSAIVISVIVIVVLNQWYPFPYNNAMGVNRILFILVSCDLLIGPLLTFLVFDTKKASLKLDLSAIILVQVIALIYGVHSIYIARPAFLVFNIDMFTVVTRLDLVPSHPEKFPFEKKGVPGPQFIGAMRPGSQTERDAILYSSTHGGADLPQMTKYFRPYSELSSEAVSHGRPLDKLLAVGSTKEDLVTGTKINRILKEKGLLASEVLFVPMKAKVRDLTVLIRKVDGSIVDTIDVEPW